MKLSEWKAQNSVTTLNFYPSNTEGKEDRLVASPIQGTLVMTSANYKAGDVDPFIIKDDEKTTREGGPIFWLTSKEPKAPALTL